MDSLSASAKGEANRHKERMVFDWDKAAQLIKEHGATTASAGLAGDWEWTGGEIYRNKPLQREETYVFLASTWARPELKLDDGMIVDCFKMESETAGWGRDTFWPESALAILQS